ncbi:MAG TPA: hypothetical protein DF383_12160 [Deltaproteobacteria bacterium]|nr:hypothetical protein [Deltaproteobacteria bacterium]
MQQRFYLMALAQALFALIFCYIFTKGYQNRGIPEGLRYGFLIALLFIPANLIFYVVQPLPRALIIAWCIGGSVEIILAGGILAALYRPFPTQASSSS